MQNQFSPFSSDSPSWYKDAIIYQLHVKSFFDGNNDGIGDFKGLTAKLDYLESLGVTAVWVLPFYPSPLKDDGYDIADYFGVHPIYGTLRDFRTFLREAHRREIRVITELVLNHTSDQHKWFKRSRQAAPNSYWRNFYVWNSSADRYRDARIIFKDFETSNWAWDPLAKAYYWHRFYSHQPDLNYENLQVRRAMLKVIDYWMEMGVDGMRLDAVPYLYEQEGTNCENLAPTYEFLRSLRAHVDQRFPNRMLLAEANQWPEDAAAYFGTGDICHMVFHFPLMPRMYMALKMENRFPIIDIFEQTPAIPDHSQWGIFLRNHDELTLEMVTDEERDYMYRAYVQDPTSRINLGIRRRLAPLLQNSRRRIEVMNILLFSLPGTPFIYYGDEIGMGDNYFLGDRNGVRTPMQWSGGLNAGFSTSNPQRLFLPLIIDPQYHYETVNVENQERNLFSLLWWMRRVIAIRRRHPAFSRGSMEMIPSDNANVLTYVRKYGNEIILVAINLSHFCQSVSLDLRAYAGYTLYDVFSANRFSRITEEPYTLTMGFHDYFWLQIQTEKSSDLLSEAYRLPDFTVGETWLELFEKPAADRLETQVLPSYLQQRTTAGCKALPIGEVKILEQILVQEQDFTALILLLRVDYTGGESDTILLPVASDTEEQVRRIIGNDQGLIMARLTGAVTSLLYDCAFHPKFHRLLLETVAGQRKLIGSQGAITGLGRRAVRQKLQDFPSLPHPLSLLKAGTFHMSFSYDNRILCKLFRRLGEGIHPDFELHQRLSEKVPLPYVAEFIGALDYRSAQGTLYEFGLFTSFVHNTGSAWNQAVDAAALFCEDILAKRMDAPPPSTLLGAWLETPFDPKKVPYVFDRVAEALGRQTAQLHSALAQVQNPDFTPEPFTLLYQRSLYQSIRSMTRQVFDGIRSRKGLHGTETDEGLKSLLEKEKDLIAVYALLLKRNIESMKIRIHGDLHLEQFIAVGNDFVIKAFGGDPYLDLSERRLKRASLQDVARLIDSFHQAAYFTLFRQVIVPPKDVSLVAPWIDDWCNSLSRACLEAYQKEIMSAPWATHKIEDVQFLLTLFLIERAVKEIGYCLRQGKEDVNVAMKTLRKYLGMADFLISRQKSKTST